MKAREDEKKGKYSQLASEIRAIYKVRTECIPIVIGALGSVPKRLLGFLKDLGIPDIIGCMQTCALLGSQRILKNVLSISLLLLCPVSLFMLAFVFVVHCILAYLAII